MKHEHRHVFWKVYNMERYLENQRISYYSIGGPSHAWMWRQIIDPIRRQMLDNLVSPHNILTDIYDQMRCKTWDKDVEEVFKTSILIKMRYDVMKHIHRAVREEVNNEE